MSHGVRNVPTLGVGFEARFKWVLNESWDSDLRPARESTLPKD